MEAAIFIKFPDSSESFAHGVEFGRLLEKMERGDEFISNNGFPIRVENQELLQNAAIKLGYIPMFGLTHWGEWIEFKGFKKCQSDN